MGKERNVKGGGSFTLMPNGRWNVRMKVTRDSDGKQKTFSATASSKQTALKEVKRKAYDWQCSTDIIDNKILLVEVLRAHLNYDRQRLNENPNIKLKHNSINRREVSIKQIERSELGTYYVDELYDGIVKDSVLRLKNEKQTKILSVSSREKVMNVIYAGLNWAVSMKMIGSNPLTDIGKKDITSDLSGQSIRESNAKDMQIEYFNEAEVNKLISTVNNTEKGNNHKYEGRELLLFLLHTGLRIGEALALRWSDYEDKYKMLNVTKSRTVVFDENAADNERYKMREGTTKNYEHRRISLFPEAISVLEELKLKSMHTEDDDYIFITSNGNPDTTSNAEGKLRVIYIAAGVKNPSDKNLYSCHLLRHTFATIMYKRGNPIEMIAKYIGDEVDTARKYYVSLDEKDEDKGVYVKLNK